jgi:hypothetical protein
MMLKGCFVLIIFIFLLCVHIRFPHCPRCKKNSVDVTCPTCMFSTLPILISQKGYDNLPSSVVRICSCNKSLILFLLFHPNLCNLHHAMILNIFQKLHHINIHLYNCARLLNLSLKSTSLFARSDEAIYFSLLLK